MPLGLGEEHILTNSVCVYKPYSSQHSQQRKPISCPLYSQPTHDRHNYSNQMEDNIKIKYLLYPLSQLKFCANRIWSCSFIQWECKAETWKNWSSCFSHMVATETKCLIKSTTPMENTASSGSWWRSKSNVCVTSCLVWWLHLVVPWNINIPFTVYDISHSSECVVGWKKIVILAFFSSQFMTQFLLRNKHCSHL